MSERKPLRAVLTVVQGESERFSRTLQWGLAVQPFSVGARGDWAIRGTGVLDTHFYLAFDGQRLRIAAAAKQARVVVHGKDLSEGWTTLDLPLEIAFGEARLGAHAAVGQRSPWSGAPSLVSLTTELGRDDLGWTRTFPGLGALDPQACRPLPAARDRRAMPPELSETRCDFGALREHARRLEKAASGAATAASTRRYLERLQRETSRALPPARVRPRVSGALGSAGEPAPGGVQSPAPMANTAATSSSEAASKPAPRRVHGMATALASAARATVLTLTERAPALRRRALATLQMTGSRRRSIAVGIGLSLITLVGIHRASRAVTSAPEVAPPALVTHAPVLAQGSLAAVAVGADEPSAPSGTGAVDGPRSSVPVEPRPTHAEHAANELQRAAFRASFSGDLRTASALYRELASGPGGRVFELAARLANEDHVRKP